MNRRGREIINPKPQTLNLELLTPPVGGVNSKTTVTYVLIGPLPLEA